MPVVTRRDGQGPLATGVALIPMIQKSRGQGLTMPGHPDVSPENDDKSKLE